MQNNKDAIIRDELSQLAGSINSLRENARMIGGEIDSIMNRSEMLMDMNDEVDYGRNQFSYAAKKKGGGLLSSISNFFGGSSASNRQPAARRGYGGMENMNMMDEENLFDGDFEQERRTVRTQFQQTETTLEYAEMHYYNDSTYFNTQKVTENPFWVDFADYILENETVEKFVSSNFVYSGNNDTQLAATLAVLDLPDVSPDHIYNPVGAKGIEITIKENAILFKKEIKEADSDLDNNLLVIHRFFEANNESSEKKIKEFIVNQVYGCETIITNVSTKAQDFQILWQIPEGSLPLQNTNYQKSENKNLNSYSTSIFKYYFYFPKVGDFILFPANITIGEKVVAVANECKFKVVEERTVISDETFKDILLSGDRQAIINFLSTANLHKGDKGFNFNHIYWLLNDRDFYLQVIETLRDRKIYDFQTWAYSFKHFDEVSIKEFLMLQGSVLIQTGTFFKSSLIECSPESSNLRHLDYFPIVNARAHKLGGNSNSGIMNKQFRQTYHTFLLTLASKPALSHSDYLTLTYYLLLQDRINEAIEVFQRIEGKLDFEGEGTLNMQYDYMRAYLDFFIGTESGFKVAKEISSRYKEYPILSWQILFTEILDQLEEFEEGVDYDEDLDQEDEGKRKQNLKKSVNLEPMLH
jgi:hypothetical protein